MERETRDDIGQDDIQCRQYHYDEGDGGESPHLFAITHSCGIEQQQSEQAEHACGEQCLDSRLLGEGIVDQAYQEVSADQIGRDEKGREEQISDFLFLW